MLDNTPDNQRNTKPDTLALASLGDASDQFEVFRALTLDAIESAGLPELEKALELALEWPRTNHAFSEISQALLEDLDSATLGFKSRLCAAYAQNLEQMSGAHFDSQAALKFLRLVKSVEHAINTLKLIGDLRSVPEFERLPSAILKLTGSLFDPASQAHHASLKRSIVESLSREIIPALDEADALDWSFRRKLSEVVKGIFAQEDISVAIRKDDTESINYFLNILDLAHVAQSKALQPSLMEITEQLLDSYTCAAARLEKNCGKVTVGVFLASAISALSASGDSPKMRLMLSEIYENAEMLSAPWNEAFLALSRIQLGLTYEQLPLFVTQVLENKVIEEDLALLKFLHVPGGIRAVSVEFRRARDQSLVNELAVRYTSYFDSPEEGALVAHTRDRDALREIFRGYGIEF